MAGARGKKRIEAQADTDTIAVDLDALEQAAAELRLPHLEKDDITIARLVQASGRSREYVRLWLAEQTRSGKYKEFEALGDSGQTVKAYRLIEK